MFPWLHSSCPVAKIEAKEIIRSIAEAEKKTSAEIRVHYTTKKGKIELLKEAKKTFLDLKMENTQHRNGVLIFLRLQSKEISIVGDIGIHQRVGDTFWHTVKDEMIAEIRNGNLTQGIIKGIELAGKQLALHFPPDKNNPNELSDEITHS